MDDDLIKRIRVAGERRKWAQDRLRQATSELKAALTEGAGNNFGIAMMAEVAGVTEGTASKWVMGKSSTDYRSQRGRCTYPHGLCLRYEK